MADATDLGTYRARFHDNDPDLGAKVSAALFRGFDAIDIARLRKRTAVTKYVVPCLVVKEGYQAGLQKVGKSC